MTWRKINKAVAKLKWSKQQTLTSYDDRERELILSDEYRYNWWKFSERTKNERTK